jgi:hypothetical protein
MFSDSVLGENDPRYFTFFEQPIIFMAEGGGGGWLHAYSAMFSVLGENDPRYLKTFCPVQPHSGPDCLNCAAPLVPAQHFGI